MEIINTVEKLIETRNRRKRRRRGEKSRRRRVIRIGMAKASKAQANGYFGSNSRTS
jgi:DNA polymerase elongation subunit (family B)